MKKIIVLFMIMLMGMSLVACGENSEKETLSEEEISVTDTTPELEPNLQRLQGRWVVSENYEDDEPSFGYMEGDRRVYMINTFEGNQWVYQSFSSGKDAFENTNEFVKVTINEDESSESQTSLIAETTNGREIGFVLYDNPEIYKNGSMLEYANLMFVKIDDEQYLELENIKDEINYNNAMEQTKEELRKSPPKVGMTESQVRNCAWGAPNDINRDEYSWGVKEQWVYDEGYVYFEDGIVTSVSYR